MAYPVLSVEAIQKLAADHARLEREVHNVFRRLAAFRNELQEPGVVVGKTDGSGISAASGTTVGSGNVTIYTLPVGSTTISTTGQTVTCYNVAGAVDANEYVLMARDDAGRYWVVVERC